MFGQLNSKELQDKVASLAAEQSNLASKVWELNRTVQAFDKRFDAAVESGVVKASVELSKTLAANPHLVATEDAVVRLKTITTERLQEYRTAVTELEKSVGVLSELCRENNEALERLDATEEAYGKLKEDYRFQTSILYRFQYRPRGEIILDELAEVVLSVLTDTPQTVHEIISKAGLSPHANMTHRIRRKIRLLGESGQACVVRSGQRWRIKRAQPGDAQPIGALPTKAEVHKATNALGY